MPNLVRALVKCDNNFCFRVNRSVPVQRRQWKTAGSGVGGSLYRSTANMTPNVTKMRALKRFYDKEISFPQLIPSLPSIGPVSNYSSV